MASIHGSQGLLCSRQVNLAITTPASVTDRGSVSGHRSLTEQGRNSFSEGPGVTVTGLKRAGLLGHVDKPTGCPTCKIALAVLG